MKNDIEKRINRKQNQYLTNIIKLSKLDETDTETCLHTTNTENVGE